MKNNILEKAGVFVIILCLTSGFIMNTAKKTDDLMKKNMFIEEKEYSPSLADDIFMPPWEKIYPFDYYASPFYSVSKTLDGNFISSGAAFQDGLGNVDFLLAKTDKLGNELFHEDYGGSLEDWALHAEQTSDGGYIITGWTYSYGAGLSDCWLVKTDEYGNEQWSKTFGGQYYWDSGRCVRQTFDGGYIITGKMMGTDTDADCWLIKTDGNGNEQWIKTFTYKEDWVNFGFSVQQTQDGGYVFLMISFKVPIDIPFYRNRRLILIRTDSNGDELWRTNFGRAFAGYSESLQITSNNDYIVAFSYPEPIGLLPEQSGCIAKVNSDGTLAWKKLYAANTNTHILWGGVKQTPDGGYIATGLVEKRDAHIGNSDLWLVKLDSEGNYKWAKVWYDYDYKNDGNSIELYDNGDYLVAGEKSTGWWGDGWLVHEPKITDQSAPIKPDPPQGPRVIKYDTEYTYTASTTDPDGDNIKYCFLWGYEGLWSENDLTWSDWVPSGEEVTVTHTWYEYERDAIYKDKPYIQVLAVDDSNHKLESEYSDPRLIWIPRSVGVVAGTYITMALETSEFAKPIEEIIIGDAILSYDPINECVTSAEVVCIQEFTEELPANYLVFNNNLQIDPENTIFLNGRWAKASDAILGDYMLENIPGTPDVFQTQISQIDQVPTSTVTFYNLAISPLEGNVSGYWADGILVGDSFQDFQSGYWPNYYFVCGI